MNLNCLAGKIAKDDGGRCDDAFGTGGQEGAFSVADGLGSEPATSGYLAQEVADWYVRSPENALQELSPDSHEAQSLAERWIALSSPLGKCLDNPQEYFEKAGCTLAGVSIAAASSGETYQVDAVIVGDCAVFHFDDRSWDGNDNDGTLKGRRVKTGADALTNNSLRIAFAPRRIQTTVLPNIYRFDALPGSTIILATDALAAWIHQKFAETSAAPAAALGDFMHLRNESQFVEWVRMSGFSKEIAEDDVAMVRIHLGPMENGVAPVAPPPLDAASEGGPTNKTADIARSDVQTAGTEILAEVDQEFGVWSRRQTTRLLNSADHGRIEEVEITPTSLRIKRNLPTNSWGSNPKKDFIASKPWLKWVSVHFTRRWVRILTGALVLSITVAGAVSATIYLFIRIVMFVEAYGFSLLR